MYSDMYQERPSVIPGAVVWQGSSTRSRSERRVVPDGCMDLIRVEGALLVAGPDTHAHIAPWRAGAHYLGLRFAPGTGPTVLGVPAHELRDQRVPLEQLWPTARVRRLTASLERAPGGALEELARRRLQDAGPVDPLVPAITGLLRAGAPVAATARALGLGERRLHRISRAAFGYGPKTLARILRMNRALELARSGVRFATVAAEAGYADQAHLSREVRALTGVPLGALTP